MNIKRFISPGFFVIILLCFMLPFFSVSCGGYKIIISGYELVIGKSMKDFGSSDYDIFGSSKNKSMKTERTDPYWGAILLLLVTITGLVISLIGLKKGGLIAGIISAVGILVMIVILIDASGGLKNTYGMIEAKIEIGYYLIFLIYLISAGFNFFISAKQKTSVPSIQQNTPFIPSPPPVQTQTNEKVCSVCKTSNPLNAAFCRNCGSKL
jgi:hypothetical protein